MPSAGNSPVAAIVFDWAGTMVDHGSLAPVRTLQRLLSNNAIEVADEVTRRDMGLAKHDHIRNLLAEPEVAAAWQQRFGREATQADADVLYAAFIPLQMSCLIEYSDVIAGVPAVVEQLRQRGIRIGGTTGYTRAMFEPLSAHAARQGYSPDRSLCPEDVGRGRPHPFMCYRLASDLHAAPLSACIKVGDTLSDIEEGRNAGMWTVGITRTGNMIGLSAEEWAALPEQQQRTKLAAASAQMLDHGANFVVESVAVILPVIDAIAEKIAGGMQPH